MPDNRGHNSNNVKSWWSVEKYDTGASAWVSTNAFPAPSLEAMDDSRVGNAQMVLMADGSLGRIVPSVRWNHDAMRMVFHKSTTTANLISEFNTYMNDNTGVRITTHTGEKLEGYIDAVNKLWDLRPGSNQQHTIEVLIQQFDVDGSGTIND